MTASSSTLSNRIRTRIVSAASQTPSRGSHLGGALSCVDILASIASVFSISVLPSQYHEASLVLSKGHACLSLYSLLVELGIMSNSTFNSFQVNGSKLGGHPTRDISQGISVSTGSLGLGISHAVGQALYLKRQFPDNPPFVCCIIGDGESSEGIVHESLNLAAFQSLSNLLVFLDNNKYQQTGSTSAISNSLNWSDYCSSLNLQYFAIPNGHDHDSLIPILTDIMNLRPSSQPSFFDCHTIKGFGFPHISQDNSGHYTSLTSDQVSDFFSRFSV